jgi:hypothetical protein
MKSKLIMGDQFFLNFVEEGIRNMQYVGYVGGRIEVSKKTGYPIEEIRFFTQKSKEYNEFRKKWDFEWVSARELVRIKKIVAKKFCDGLD